VTDVNLESALPDLEILLVEMVSSVLREEVLSAGDPLPAAELATSRLIIHDLEADSYLGVEVRTEDTLARMLAASMFAVADPTADDVLDAIAELGNIAGGNVKSLLWNSARLSLPTPSLSVIDPGYPSGSVRVAVRVLGHVVEMVVMPLTSPDQSTCWPPSFAEPMSSVMDH
jgi:hypothetical protein